jgi:hypothetical protein
MATSAALETASLRKMDADRPVVVAASFATPPVFA